MAKKCADVDKGSVLCTLPFSVSKKSDTVGSTSLPCVRGDSPGGGNVAEGDKRGALVVSEGEPEGLSQRKVSILH